MGRLRARLRYLWTMHPDGVELLSAALSATFGVTLIHRPPGTAPLDYAPAFAVVCFLAAGNKALGVIYEWRSLRLLGLTLGAFFWSALSCALILTNPNSIAWLCFAVMALAQIWAAWRNMRP